MKEYDPQDRVNNRYTVVRKLGAGAMGSVYLCEDPVENNIQVALKVLVSENLDDQDVWAKGEYETLTRLRHPHLARVYNFGKIHNSTDYFIVSEFIKGTDLFSATEYVNYEELNDIIVQTCRALDYIHSKGYVHFDVKPDNILVTRHKTFGIKEGSKVQYNLEDFSTRDSVEHSKPHVKLIDFGLAERITGSFSFAIKGTLNYLAPEIISGKTPDRRADLYSLGVTLYQVTNRDLPVEGPGVDIQRPGFNAMKRSDLFEYHMKKQPDYLRALIMKLLEESPNDRFQTAGEAIHFLSEHSGKQYEVETKETQTSYLHSTRMVGRKKEMHLLKSVFERAFFPERKGTDAEAFPVESAKIKDSKEAKEQLLKPGALPQDDMPVHLVVSGEIGIGKSRLLEEFQHFLRLNDTQLYSGNCYEGTSNAYQPFIEMLRQIVYGLGLDSQICQSYQGVLGRLLPEMQAGESESSDRNFRPDQEKIFFIDRISQFLLDAALERPCVLFLNNLHWADEATVELLGALLDRVEAYPKKKDVLKLLVISSLRSDEQYTEGFKDFLAQAKDSPFCQEIQLRRLKRSQLVDLLQSMLGIREIPVPFLDRLEEKTGGNPLFVQETLKALQDQVVLTSDTGGWRIKTTAYNRIDIPQSLEELILTRIRKLEDVKLEMLEVMSALNRPVSPKVLQKFKRFASLPILAHLRDLEDSGLLSKVFEGGKLMFQIDQPKIREILYANLGEGNRRRYHGEVADVYEEIHRGHEEEILEDLAYHYQRSDLTERALAMAVRAGDRLKAIYANDRALEFFLYIAEKIAGNAEKDDLWVETQEKIGELCTIIGRYELAEQSYDSLLNFGDETNYLTLQAVSRYYRKKGNIFEIQGDYDNALRCYKEARNRLSGFEDTEIIDEKIRVFICIGWVYVCMGKYEKATEISVEGLRGIEGAAERAEHAMIYQTIGSANYCKGNFPQSIEYHRRSLKIHENLENIPDITACLNNLGKSYLANADFVEALEHLNRALGNSEEIGDPYGKAVSLHNLGCTFFELRRIDQAEAYVADSLQLSRGYTMRFLNIENYILYGKILREQRDYSRAESYLFRALTAYSKQGNRWGLCTILLELVVIQRLRGNLVDAASMVEDAYRYATDLNIDFLVARCLLEKGRVLKDSGELDLEKVQRPLEEALKISNKLEGPEILADIYHEIGDVYVKSRRLQDANDQYRLAEERVRDVLEYLPPEYRQSYQRKFPVGPLAISGELRETLLSAPTTVEARPVSVRTIKGSTRAALGSNAGARRHAVALEQETLGCMNELMQALTNSPSIESFLQLTLKRLLEVSRSCAAYILTRSGDRLHLRASLSQSSDRRCAVEHVVVLKLVHKCLQTRSSMAIPDLVRDSRLVDLNQLVRQGYRSLVIVPYHSNSEDGVFYLLDPVPRAAQLEDDVAFYSFFTSLLPLALMHLEPGSHAAAVGVDTE